MPCYFCDAISHPSAVRPLQMFGVASLFCCLGGLPTVAQGADIDLSKAVIVGPAHGAGPERKAVDLLVSEVQKRTRITWPVTTQRPAGSVPVIVLTSPDSENGSAKSGPLAPEGFRISVEKTSPAPAIVIRGRGRGLLFGVGRLLRELRMGRDRATLPDDLAIESAPKYPLRGHQLGYRPKTNSYDGWDLAQWEQYIRDLVVFGTNAIELIPPRSDDARDSPHFPLPPIEMMVGMSKLADDYGLDVWIWYPAMDANYVRPATVEFALKEWGEVFRRLPRVDAVFVPGGDPGHTRPRTLFALLEKQAANLHRYHPKAQMWMSPQSFTAAWFEEFLSIVKTKQSAWLAGIVYGPESRFSLPELRRLLPTKYPIRRYPDITHSLRCQYPVPDWDLAFALTEARECINPRPLGEAVIFRAFAGQANGFLAYSEGCNDDVNKIVWSSLGWNPDEPVIEILRQYGRYFIGDRYTDSFAQGLLSLEKNWQGPLLTNENVYTTLRQFQALEKAAAPRDKLNWRFQQALYRAYYDAYTRRRLLYETELEEKAMDELRGAKALGAREAMQRAEAALDRAVTNRVAPEWRARVFELAEALFQSIRMQLSVPRYQAIEVGRGATLDTLDAPLNNRLWLKQRFEELRRLDSELERRSGIMQILNWDDPGPGGFYDDLGNLTRQPHLVRGADYAKDPAFLRSSLVGFTYRPGWRMSWCSHAESLYDTPLELRYDHLDPKARYRVRAVYAGDRTSSKIRLVANDGVEIHPFLAKQLPVRPVEFDVPAEATTSGRLRLVWTQEPGRGGNGRGCQVAEVWLIKQSSGP